MSGHDPPSLLASVLWARVWGELIVPRKLQTRKPYHGVNVWTLSAMGTSPNTGSPTGKPRRWAAVVVRPAYEAINAAERLLEAASRHREVTKRSPSSGPPTRKVYARTRLERADRLPERK